MLRGLAHNQPQHAGQKYHCHQVYTGKAWADDKGHDHGADQRGRRPHTHTQNHLICILHIRHIGSQPGHQSRGAEFIDVGKAEGLDIFIHSLPQVPGKTGGCPGTELPSQNAEGKA